MGKWKNRDRMSNGFKLGMLKKLYHKQKNELGRCRRDFIILSYLTR